VQRGATAGQHAAVDGQGRTGDPARAVAGEERDRLDDVARLPAAAERVEAVDGVEHLLRLLVGEEALVGRRLHERQRDGVDADVIRRELEREVLGQRVAARLGGRVGAGRGRGDRVQRPHRADADDRAAAALAHRLRGGLRDPVGRVQDRAQRLLQMLLGLLEERHDPEDPGRVHEHVDAAEALHGPLAQRLRLLAAGDLPGDELDALAAGVELVARGLEHRGPGTGQHDARAVVQEAPRRGLADPASTARDDDHLAREAHRVLRSY